MCYCWGQDSSIWGEFVRGVGCLDWTCGYCSGQVGKEKYDYMIDKIFEGVEQGQMV